MVIGSSFTGPPNDVSKAFKVTIKTDGNYECHQIELLDLSAGSNYKSGNICPEISYVKKSKVNRLMFL